MVDVYTDRVIEWLKDFITCGGMSPEEIYGIFMEIPYTYDKPDYIEVWDNKRRLQELVKLICFARLYFEFLVFNLERLERLEAKLYSAPTGPEVRPHRLVW